MEAMVQKDRTQSEVDEACQFIEALAEASQLCGVSSRIMVLHLDNVVRALGMKGEFLATPNYIESVLWGADPHRQRVRLTITRSGNFNLARLESIREVSDRVVSRQVSPSQGFEMLKEILVAPDRYGRLATGLAFMLCGACFAVILGGTWMDVAAGGIISLASFGVTLAAARSAGFAAIQELLAAIIAALLASGAAALLPGIHPTAVAACAVLWFIPGFGLTIAPNELMYGNTLSGVIWLTNAVVTALKLFGGSAIGFAIAQSLIPEAAKGRAVGSVPHELAWFAVPVMVVAFAVLMKANMRNFPWIIIGGWMVWAAMMVGDPYGSWQGTFLGAAILMIYANWYNHWGRASSTVIMLPCVMILLPGLAALRALYTLKTEGILAGFHSGYEVIVMVVAIIGGVLVGDSLALHKIAETGRSMKNLVVTQAGSVRKHIRK